MAEVQHIKIAGGLGEQLKDKIIRIGHMSPTVGEADIDQVLGIGLLHPSLALCLPSHPARLARRFP
jgi:hypothetical protein